MNMNLPGVMIAIAGLAVCLMVWWFAFSMTQGKPTGRVAAIIGAMSLTILTAVVVYNLNRAAKGQPTGTVIQSR